MIHDSRWDPTVTRLRGAKRVVALTGAGISAESGVPTFRGPEGLWKNFRPEDLATPEAFARDPQLVWEWYIWRRGRIAPCAPNPAHHALVTLEQRIPDFTLITQNVDGLHRRARSRNVLHLHGTIWEVRCTGCGRVEENRDPDLAFPPLCPACGKLRRPNVVWFGEALDPTILSRAEEALQKCEILLVVGTSAVVQPAASMALWAKKAGAYVVEINLEPTPLSRAVDMSFQGKAGEILPRML
ncbi:MAG: NAD-dependent deacylase [Proteobacteria bacterium]|nr:NAD-dependent deacylase [Pseudomonadota bacterium]